MLASSAALSACASAVLAAGDQSKPCSAISDTDTTCSIGGHCEHSAACRVSVPPSVWSQQGQCMRRAGTDGLSAESGTCLCITVLLATSWRVHEQQSSCL
jgi:hypothetical protein